MIGRLYSELFHFTEILKDSMVEISNYC